MSFSLPFPTIRTRVTKTFFVTLCISLLTPFLSANEGSEVIGINLDSLRTSGYRVDWMNQSSSNNLRLPTILGDSLYTVDSEDNVTRYDFNSGDWLWSSPVGNKVFTLRSVTEFKDQDRVYVLSDGACYVLERATGNYPTNRTESASSRPSEKHVLPLKWVANTPAITTNHQTLTYGSTNGDTVWFNPSIGFDTHRYQIGSAIYISPTFVEGKRSTNGLLRKAIVASAKDGSLVAVDLNDIQQLWSLQYTNPVEAQVEYGTSSTVLDGDPYERSSVFIAGTDQYLRAVDLHTGKQRWNILTAKTLTDSPVFYKDRLYQQIPGDGLASFEAFPRLLTGKQLWLANDVHGNVITTTKSNQLVTWDQGNGLLQVVDPRKGGVVSTLEIPNTKTVLSDKLDNGSILILTHDNTLLRLVPRQ